ncbi:MAG: PmeII family type II restriction endonuclease [Candidatus Helarchaeota archaeon]
MKTNNFNEEMKINLVQNFIKYLLIKEYKIKKEKAIRISCQFVDLDEFLNYEFENLKNIKSPSGRPLIRLTKKEIEKLNKIKHDNLIDPKKSLHENFIRIIGRNFINTQIRNINSINLDILNPNPFLINALNLNNVEELIEILVYQRATRSIVTSFGFYLEDLLEAAGGTKLKSGFDIVKIINGIQHYIQVKSGTSDMDKDQVEFWRKKIEEYEKKGHKAYIGMPYGKLDSSSITIGLFKLYLPDWEMRTLIGKKLWDFISGENNFHIKILRELKVAAVQILNNKSILNEIRKAINKIIDEFHDKYGYDKNSIDKFINSLF